MKTQNNHEMIDKLNHLLSDLQVFYINNKGLHWNIKGDKFFELHQKFEELYNDLSISIDDLVERIVTIGSKPYHAYSDFLKMSWLKESKEILTPQKTLSLVVYSLEVDISKQKYILALAHD
jgi:starvation-inducible DNA-binding protein